MATGGIGIVAVAALGGCGVVGGKEFRDERSVDSRIATIVLAGGSGSVTVPGSSDPRIHVKRHVRYRGDKPGATDAVRNAGRVRQDRRHDAGHRPSRPASLR
jgi:hypothetical protein